ncbi:MAG: type II secretion system protein [Proteobacteria bacterium]|nr:type II secretion system protein [Pseudomonadota bacterium]
MRQRGFTLIELMITVAIIGLLALGAAPLAKVGLQRAKETQLRSALREIRSAIDAYKEAGDTGRIKKEVDKSGYPPSLEVLAAGVEDIKSPDHAKMIYFLRRIPRDPLNPDGTLPPERTWALRSYASPPDSPQPGDDVYDVYSQSPRVGLDGTPYRSW